MKKNTIFCKFLRFFCTCFQNPLFLILAFPFVGFVFPCFLFYFLLLLDKSSCYVLVFVFVVLGFLGLVVCYVFCFFGLFLVWDFFWGFKGQVRWPKGQPQLAPNPPYLFCFVFGLFCFSCWVLFVLWFLLWFIWKGFRVKWGGPLGHLAWPLNPPQLFLRFVFGLFLRVLEWTTKPCFSPEKSFFFFLCFLFNFPVHSCFSFLLYFLLSYLLSYFVLFLSFLLSFSLSFSLSPFLFPAFLFLLSLISCSLALFLSFPLFLFFVSLLFSCLSFLALLFLNFCFPCMLEQC